MNSNNKLKIILELSPRKNSKVLHSKFLSAAIKTMRRSLQFGPSDQFKKKLNLEQKYLPGDLLMKKDDSKLHPLLSLIGVLVVSFKNPTSCLPPSS